MKYFLLIALLLTVCIANAQIKGFIGFEIGPNIASIKGQNLKEEKIKPMGGIFTGITFGSHFTDQFSVKSGIYYEVKGAKISAQLEDDQGHVIPETQCKLKFQYVTIPVLFKYTVPKKSNFFINAGPYYSILIQSSLEADNVPDYGDIKIKQTQYYKSGDFGVSFGLGFSKNFASGWSIHFEVRDNLGFTNIINEGSDSYLVKHNTFNFLPGTSYKF